MVSPSESKAVVVRKITRCAIPWKCEREKKRRREEGIVVDRDCVISAGTLPAVGGWWQTVGLENRGEKAHESLNIWAKLKGGSMLNYEIFIRWTRVRLSKIYSPLYSGQNILSDPFFLSFLPFSLFSLRVMDNSDMYMYMKEIYMWYINLKRF